MLEQTTDADRDQSILKVEMVGTIVAAYVSNNQVAPESIGALIASVAQGIDQMSQFGGTTVAVPVEPATPAVSVKKSITPDFLISLESGRKLKSLKRYLRTNYGMTPEDYRAKWGLAKDYPMVAPNYAKARSDLAKKMGLGTGGPGKPPARKGVESKATTAKAAPAKRGRQTRRDSNVTGVRDNEETAAKSAEA